MCEQWSRFEAELLREDYHIRSAFCEASPVEILKGHDCGSWSVVMVGARPEKGLLLGSRQTGVSDSGARSDG